MTFNPRLRAALAAILVTVALAGCAATPPAGAVTLPDPDARFDYQLGGAYEPPEGATVIERDRTAEPSGAGYDICYVNGFQTQPADSKAFADEHPELLVQVDGVPLADPGWPDEYIFDTSTAEARADLLEIVAPWIAGCAESGFNAVEIDNLDSYTRSDDALTLEDNLALAAAYAEAAHEAGLAIAQKNTADQVEALRDLGYDFAVTESCYEFDECGAYTSVYDVVLDIEYTDELGEDGFAAACEDPGRPSSMILRDHDLVTPGDDGYVYQRCAYKYPGTPALVLDTGVQHAGQVPRTPSSAAAHIGARIAAERKARGLTQDHLAVLSGIDSSNIRSYESGRSMLSIQTLLRIADALKRDPSDFLDGLTLDMFPASTSDARRTA